MRRPRVLLAILVYDGRAFVPRCLASAVGLRVGHRDVDIVVLDDCSPDRGWSAELAEQCASLGIGYYRSPRNLGIPRNMNLALRRAVDGGYDHVLLANSDVVLPLNVVDAMVRVVEANDRVGSVTAWSNNASIYSIPNRDDQGVIDQQDMVDWISVVLDRDFGPVAVDIPAAVGFCLLVPVPVVRRVGMFDPVFGRGYCEEVDWSLRSRAAGYRAVLAPSTFVFHLGSASTASAGMLRTGQTTVDEHERIVDLRYPSYRRDLREFDEADVVPPLRRQAVRAIVVSAAQRWGYDVEATGIPSPGGNDRVRVTVEPDGDQPSVRARFGGFTLDVDVPRGADVAATLLALVGGPPARLTLFDRGRNADALAARWESTASFSDRYSYPQRV